MARSPCGGRRRGEAGSRRRAREARAARLPVLTAFPVHGRAAGGRLALFHEARFGVLANTALQLTGRRSGPAKRSSGRPPAGRDARPRWTRRRPAEVTWYLHGRPAAECQAVRPPPRAELNQSCSASDSYEVAACYAPPGETRRKLARSDRPLGLVATPLEVQGEVGASRSWPPKLGGPGSPPRSGLTRRCS